MYENVLWIDWWKKYIGLAYYNKKNWIIFPIWYLFNDEMFIYNLWNIIQKYRIWKIVLWYNEDNKESIIKFKEEITLSYNIDVILEDENFSSIESNNNDTLSALIILDRYIKNLTK